MALCRRVIKPNTSLVAAATSSVASSEAGYNAFSSLAGRSLGSHGVGRGCGVGLGLGIGVPLGVGLGGGVAVGVGVAVAVAVGVGVTEGVTVAVGVAVGVGVGLAEHTLSTSTKRATVCWFPLAGRLHAGDEEATYVLVGDYRAPSWKLDCTRKNVYCFAKQPSIRRQESHPNST